VVVVHTNLNVISKRAKTLCGGVDGRGLRFGCAMDFSLPQFGSHPEGVLGSEKGIGRGVARSVDVPYLVRPDGLSSMARKSCARHCSAEVNFRENEKMSVDL
jgi:hypothetical protein